MNWIPDFVAEIAGGRVTFVTFSDGEGEACWCLLALGLRESCKLSANSVTREAVLEVGIGMFTGVTQAHGLWLTTSLK